MKFVVRPQHIVSLGGYIVKIQPFSKEKGLIKKSSCQNKFWHCGM